MDELTATLTCVWHDCPETAERWFAVVCGVVENQAGDAEWSDLAAAIAHAAGEQDFSYETITAFCDYLETVQPLDALRRMVDERDALLVRYEQALQEALAAGEAADAEHVADPASEDSEAWNAFLAEAGPRWDGSDESWPEFRAWFVYEASTRGVGWSATAFCDYAESTRDKVGTFAQYGVPVWPQVAVEGGTSEASAAEEAPDVGAAAIEQVLTDNPDFAEVPAEELQELLREVMAEPAETSN